MIAVLVLKNWLFSLLQNYEGAHLVRN